jgi:hypothetical protein
MSSKSYVSGTDLQESRDEVACPVNKERMRIQVA